MFSETYLNYVCALFMLLMSREVMSACEKEGFCLKMQVEMSFHESLKWIGYEAVVAKELK